MCILPPPAFEVKASKLPSREIVGDIASPSLEMRTGVRGATVSGFLSQTQSASTTATRTPAPASATSVLGLPDRESGFFVSDERGSSTATGGGGVGSAPGMAGPAGAGESHASAVPSHRDRVRIFQIGCCRAWSLHLKVIIVSQSTNSVVVVGHTSDTPGWG